jgi:hypothetical protein
MIKFHTHPEFEKALHLGHVIPAILPNGDPFVIDDVAFYQAADGGISMYQGRLMAFTDVIEKHQRLKLDESTIRAFFSTVFENATQAMLQLNNEPQQAMQYLSDIAQLASYGTQRLDLYEDVSELNIGSNTARVYELSSIWFFTADEDPAAYDPIKGKRNTALMLKRPDLYDFFLRLRLNQFAPLAAHSPELTLKSIQALQESDYQGLLLFTKTLLFYRANGENPALIQSLESLTETLQSYDTCYDQLLKNLTNIWPHTSANSSSTLSSTNA